MKRRHWVVLAAAFLGAGLLGPIASGGAGATTYDGRQALRELGYVSARSPQHLAAKRVAAARAPHAGPITPRAALAPTTGSSWEGVHDSSLAPPDTNGAIGPDSYMEIINLQVGIYDRSGGTLGTATMQTLTGHSQFNMSDPMVLWDPNTQRFYFNVWDTTQASMVWGFSKSSNPVSIPGDFCVYTTTFGYTTSNAPDYPKLGQTQGFLMIGVNFYPSFSSTSSTRSDLLWISKPKGSGPVTTCPAASTFTHGAVTGLQNVDGTQAFTPVPAIQSDPSKTGFVVASADIETGGSGNFVTVFTVKPKKSDPTVLTVSAPHQVSVASYTMGPDAPQSGSSRKLDTLDGRLEHAVSGIDPRIGKMTVWTAHTVAGGAGTELRWYEILPTPAGSPTISQSGAVNDASLYVFNGSVAPDRTVNPSGSAHGANMVAGFDTSSSQTFAAVQMASKIGLGPLSGFVLVKQSPGANEDFTCGAGATCRWGDYAGATSDPAADLAATSGNVWFTNEWNLTRTNGSTPVWRTWNWQATP